ncbi:MAG: DUF5611 family protein [Candidatus Poseidoniaceae archaeon]|jgi:hypothetical protein|nr:DUF5611 family protein [Candidatus Poseidoniaceae archaeon]|tara:strand:+ start:460 stop:993 length:534 start_codon:yes stop_codon:yes gene_type:complete
MERFEVKRGLVKTNGGNAGLAKLGSQYFNDVSSGVAGGFTASFGILSLIEANYSEDGKLVVEVEQMKGQDLDEFLNSDGGRELAMESRKCWAGFLDEATGYNSKQRGDKAKEAGKKISKAKSNIRLALKMIEMSSSMTQETKEEAQALIIEVEQKLEEGNGTRALSLSVKLSKLVEG